MTATAPRLTQLSAGGGCACKVPMDLLGQVLGSLGPAAPSGAGPELLVGLGAPDDAAVVATGADRAWVLTTDFQTPILDDPFEWGQVAAVNALSDVYAMGGVPRFALNLLGWPAELDSDLLAGLLAGGQRAVTDAGAVLVGGHSIVDPVPKYGLVVLGEVDRAQLITKGGGRDGDLLVLTKPVGVGVVGTAIKTGRAPEHVVRAAVASMTRLNAGAARVAVEHGVRGGTDVSGYGLVGHLHEMATAAGVGARLDPAAVPVLPGVRELVANGVVPDGTRRTLDHAVSAGWFDPGALDAVEQVLLTDAQTSGGLLLAVSPAVTGALLAGLDAAGATAAIVGELGTGPAGLVTVGAPR